MKSKYDNLPAKTKTTAEDFIRADVPCLVNTIIADAYLKGVSDIHFETLVSNDIIRVHFRKDGVMREYMTIPFTVVDKIIKRIKGMANLDDAVCHLPKIGNIKFKLKGLPEFHIMVAVRPNDGHRELATLRIQTA